MFSAKLDDVLNFIPSRITGLLIVLGTKNETDRSLGKRLKRWVQDAKKHPSPNSGYLEAATAVQLGVQLGGKIRIRALSLIEQLWGKISAINERAYCNVHYSYAYCHSAVCACYVSSGGVNLCGYLITEQIRKMFISN